PRGAGCRSGPAPPAGPARARPSSPDARRPDHDVVAAGDDPDVELRLERAEVIVVTPEKREQVEVGGQRDPARDRGSVTQRRELPSPSAFGRSSLMCSSFSRSGATGP